MKIVEIESVSKIYQGRTVVNKLSLRIVEGERIVILGPSGCGKTTVLRLIAGFVAPESGTISIEGGLVSRDGRILIQPEDRNLGMVFQDLALWPHLSVKDNIGFGLKARGFPLVERERRIKDALELVGMTGFDDRRPAALSGGEQQRVALARALVLEPKIILMDEPLSSLDRKLNIRLRKEIFDLQRKLGFTLLYVTHDRDEAFDIASRVVLMANGMVEYEGPVEEAIKREKSTTDLHR